jgi:hypothetical protein
MDRAIAPGLFRLGGRGALGPGLWIRADQDSGRPQGAPAPGGTPAVSGSG